MGIGALTAPYRSEFRGYGARPKSKDFDFSRSLFAAMADDRACRTEEAEPDLGDAKPKETAPSRENARSAEEAAAAERSIADYRQMILDHMAQMEERIERGEIEEKIAIGGQAFTQKEWEELLTKFDAVMEEIREAVAEEVEKKEEAAQEADARMDMLVSEMVQARFSSQETEEDIYLIAMDADGIRCCRAGSSEYEWQIVFTDESQYQRAAELMEWAEGIMDNFRFAAHVNFWEDYLNGNLDVDAFKEFLEGTDNGVPNYGIGDGENMRIDRDKIGWAKYMNPLGTKLYTGEEFAAMIARQIEENAAKLKQLQETEEQRVTMETFMKKIRAMKFMR